MTRPGPVWIPHHQRHQPDDGIENLGLAAALPAELQQFDGAGDQPVQVVVVLWLEPLLISRQACAVEALDELAGDRLRHI